MPTRTKIKAGILAWVVLEVLALAVAVHFLGWLPTLAAGMLTSTLGLMILRKVGREALAAVKQAMEGQVGGIAAVPSAGLTRVLSGLLLLLPGFVSDVAGLVLALPFVSRRILRPLGETIRPQRDGVVDLGRDEWRTAQERGPRPSCEPLPGMLPGGSKAAHSRSLDDE